MKIEIIPQTEGGFTVIFLDSDKTVVNKIKSFSSAVMSQMGYRLEPTILQETDNLFFFNVKSSDRQEIKAEDLVRSLKDIVAEK